MQRVHSYLRVMIIGIAIVSCMSRGAEEKGEEESKEQRGVFEEQQREAQRIAEQTERDARIAQELAARHREEMEQAAMSRVRVIQAEDKKELAELLKGQPTKPVSQDTLQELSRLSRRGGQAQRKVLGQKEMRQMIGAFDSVWSDRRLVRKVNDTAASLAVSVDGRYLVVGTSKGAIEIWDTHVWGQPMKVINLSPESIDYITVSPDGRYCACGSSRLRKIFVFTVNNWEVAPIVLNEALEGRAHEYSWLIALTFTSDGRYLLSGSLLREMWRWNTQDWVGTQLVARDAKFRNIAALAFAPDGSYVAGVPITIVRGRVRENTPVLLWEQNHIEDKNPISLELPKKKYKSVLFSPDGRFLACRSADGVVTIMHKVRNRWGKMEWRQLTELSERNSRLSCMVFSADGRYFACEISIGKVAVYATDEWRNVMLYTKEQPGPITSIVFSSDNRYLAVCHQKKFTNDFIDIKRIERK